MQIYNEKIFDLIQDKKRDHPLQLREKRGTPNSVYVQGLSEYKIYSVDDIYDLLRRGARNRAIRSTEMNAESSRSHCILQLFIQIQCLDTTSSATTIHSGLISFVDLAGSEKWRPALSQAGNGQVEVQKEMTNINTSLHVLGNCVSALVEAGRKHIPYRDSVLTRLLQDSIGGAARTILIATVKNADAYKEETYSTLQFASRASRIKSVVRQNKEIDMTLEQAKKEIVLLREQLSKRIEKIDRPPSRSHSSSTPTVACKCEEYRSTISSLEDTISSLRKENAKLVQSLTSLREDVITLQSQSEKQQQLRESRRYSSGSDDSNKSETDYKPRPIASPVIDTRKSQAIRNSQLKPLQPPQLPVQISQQLPPQQQYSFSMNPPSYSSYQYSSPANTYQPKSYYPPKQEFQTGHYNNYQDIRSSNDSLRQSTQVRQSIESTATSKTCSKHGLEACVLCEMFGDSSSMSGTMNRGDIRANNSSMKSDLCPIHHVTACLLCTLSTTTPTSAVYTASPKYEIPSVPPSIPSVKHFQYSPHGYPGSQDSHSLGYGFTHQQPSFQYQQYQQQQQISNDSLFRSSYREVDYDDAEVVPSTKFPSLRSSYRDSYPQESPPKVASSPKAVRFDSMDEKPRRRSDIVASPITPVPSDIKTSLTAPNSDVKRKPRITYEDDDVDTLAKHRQQQQNQKLNRPAAPVKSVPKKKKKPKAKLPTKSPYNT